MTARLLLRGMVGKLSSIGVETIGLQTPRGRLLFFGIVSGLMYVIPYSWLAHLSLWQYIGVNSPSVGLTRAYWLLLHGSVTEAFVRNPLIFVVIALGLPLLCMDVFLLIKKVKLVLDSGTS